jgi:hypothetical protein
VFKRFSARAQTAENLAAETRASTGLGGAWALKQVNEVLTKSKRRGWHSAFKDFGPRKSQSKTAMELGKKRVALLAVTSHWSYEVVNAAVIALNAVVLAWETQHSSRKAMDYEEGDGFTIEFHFQFLMVIFCLLFVTDLALRITAQGLGFFLSSEWKWNLFDIVVVTSTVIETIMTLVDAERSTDSGAVSDLAATISMMRMLRLLRVLRIARSLKFMIFFRELRILVSSLWGGLRQLLWSTVILMVTVLIVGVFMTDGAIRHMVQSNTTNAESTSVLRYYYGTLFRSMATLYWAIAGGEDWARVLEPLSILTIEYTIIFYCFITFSLFAMLNVMNAVFVDYTLQRSQNDREYLIDTEVSGRKEFMSTMHNLFQELDRNDSGEISLEELETHMQEPKVVAYFSALNLDVKQVNKLFNLMDLDKSGTLDPEEFVFGCVNLKGNAKTLDLAILQYETRWLRNLVIQLGDHLDDYFGVGCATTAPSAAGSGGGMPSPTFARTETVTIKEESTELASCIFRREDWSPDSPGSNDIVVNDLE